MKRLLLIPLSLLTGWLLLGGSEPSSKDLWENYQSRLTRALEIDRVAVVEEMALSSWPSRQSREVSTEPIRLGLWEAYGFRACPELLTRVAERNSQLGRVMLPSQQWLYELRLATTLAACVDTTESPLEESVQAELKELQLKVDQRLPRSYWNFLVTSDALKGLFERSGGRLKPGSAPPIQEIAGLLERLFETSQQLNAGELPDYPQDFEQELRLLSNQASLAQLLYALEEANRYLDAINTQLQQRLGGNPLCVQPSPQLPRAQVSRNVLYNIFMMELQPWLAELERQAQLLLPRVSALYDYSEAPLAIERYRKQWLDPDNSLTPWRRFQRLNREHAGHWQELLEQCGFVIGKII